ncbi:MAG: FlgD immunoglobulin-like domain containing protein [Candidatus Kapaibacteriales bacterium]
MISNFKLLSTALVALIASTYFILSDPSVKIERSVFGNGGLLETVSNSNWKISGIVGQVAIDKISIANRVLYQGFWFPAEYVTSVDDESISLSSTITNFPNPAYTSTTFRFVLDESSYVTLKVYDMVGNLVKILIDGVQPSGEHQIFWNLKSDDQLKLPSGNYYYELSVTPGQVAGLSNAKPKVVRNILVIVK